MAINLTNQTQTLTYCKQFKTLATNQIKVRNRILQKMPPAQLKAFYKSGKDPVLVELYQIYKAMDKYFSNLLESEE